MMGSEGESSPEGLEQAWQKPPTMSAGVERAQIVTFGVGVPERSTGLSTTRRTPGRTDVFRSGHHRSLPGYQPSDACLRRPWWSRVAVLTSADARSSQSWGRLSSRRLLASAASMLPTGGLGRYREESGAEIALAGGGGPTKRARAARPVWSTGCCVRH